MRSSIVALAGLVATCAGVLPDVAMAMNGYKWKNRPIVVFAPSGDDARVARQREVIDDLKPAFLDRQVVLVIVAGDKVSVELGPPPQMSAEALRARFGVAQGAFKVLLVGKDGGVKLSSEKPISAQTLFRTIDAMPMRSDEVKKR